MATQQGYLDDLERHGMVRVTVDEKTGEKTYAPRVPLSPPPFSPQAYIPAATFPEEWNDQVLQNFQNVYLYWWRNAFRALKAKMEGTPFQEFPPAFITDQSVYNPDTGLVERKTP